MHIQNDYLFLSVVCVWSCFVCDWRMVQHFAMCVCRIFSILALTLDNWNSISRSMSALNASWWRKACVHIVRTLFCWLYYGATILFGANGCISNHGRHDTQAHHVLVDGQQRLVIARQGRQLPLKYSWASGWRETLRQPGPYERCMCVTLVRGGQHVTCILGTQALCDAYGILKLELRPWLGSTM